MWSYGEDSTYVSNFNLYLHIVCCLRVTDTEIITHRFTRSDSDRLDRRCQPALYVALGYHINNNASYTFVMKI